MSRPIRSLAALLIVSFALVASACADSTAPHPLTCDVNNPNVCH